jgi:hypothetical protein
MADEIISRAFFQSPFALRDRPMPISASATAAMSNVFLAVFIAAV